MVWGSAGKNAAGLASTAANVGGNAAIAGATTLGAGAGATALIAGQTAATVATDAAQLANIGFMTHNTLNGIMLEQFSSTMETLRKANHLGMKTLEKSVPEPPQ